MPVVKARLEQLPAIRCSPPNMVGARFRYYR
jgi:hypothetical protein